MHLIRLRLTSVLLAVFVQLNGVQLWQAATDRKANSDEWLPFECDDQKAADIQLNRTGRFLIYRTDLYFYFKDFVVKLEKPILDVVHDSGIQRHSLRYRSPTYLPYSSLTNRPTILEEQYENATALFQKLATKSNEVYLIRETSAWLSNSRNYSMRLNKLIFQNGRLGDVETLDEKFLGKYVRKLEKATGFVHVDPVKWLVYSYLSDRILFELLQMNEDTQQLVSKGHASLSSLDYLVMHSAYYQLSSNGSETSWTGNMIEIDAMGMVHIHSLAFGYSPVTNFTVYTLIRTKQSLANLLECPDPTKPKPQMKGFFYRRTPTNELIAYLFIDNHYLRLQADPVESRFVLRAENAEDLVPRKVEFDSPEDSSIEFERLASLKYVKNVARMPYLTFDNQKSYKILFLGSGSSERLVAVKEGLVKAHLCPYQTLMIGDHVFCFRKQFYYLISKDWLHHGFHGRHRSIHEIFEGSRMVYDKEDLELIITNQPSFKKTENAKHDIVFVFASWLLKFDSFLFEAVEDPRDPNDREIRLRFLQTLPLFSFERRRNCFWSNCEDYDGEGEVTDVYPGASKDERDVSENVSLIRPLLWLLPLLIISVILVKMLTLKSNELRRMVSRTRESPMISHSTEKLRAWVQLAKKKGSELIAKRRRSSKTSDSVDRVEVKRSLSELKSVKSIKSIGAKSLGSVDSVRKNGVKWREQPKSKEKLKEKSKMRLKEQSKMRLKSTKSKPKVSSKANLKDSKANLKDSKVDLKGSKGAKK